MMKLKLFNWVLIALLAFQFTACNNEPLVGQFPQQEDPTVAEEGQFIAQIDGVSFIATFAGATMTSENLLVVTGIIEATGEVITLTAEDVTAPSIFNLIAVSGTENAAKYFDIEGTTNPYISTGAMGGSGQLTITDLNTTDFTISGTFSFVGVRVQLDANGDPVLDGNGNPIIQSISVTPGTFNTIPYVIDDTGGGGGGGGGGDPTDEFYALLDGEEFVDTMISTTLTTIGGVDMVNIIALTSSNASMRIDLPLFLGEGTFDMESLSDGTQIISVYNSNTVGENLTSNPGTITITNFDTEAGIIVATFQFTGTDPLGGDPTIVEVTEGSFTLHFEGIPGSGPGPFTAEVDGVLYEPETINTTLTLFSGTIVVNISTSTTDNRSLSLSFPKDIEVGTYEMSSIATDGTVKIGRYNPDLIDGTTIFSSNPGMLTITSYDLVTGEIEGTFSFTATDPSLMDPATFDITNGTFHVTVP